MLGINAKLILEGHRFGNGKITLSIAQLKEKLQIFETAQETSCTEPYKLGLLRTIMKANSNKELEKLYDFAILNRYNFHQILNYIIEFSERVNVPVSLTMAAMTNADQFCYQYQMGNCKRLDCRFKHQIMTDQQKRESNYSPEKLGKKSEKPKGNRRNNEKNKFKNNNNEGINGMHNANKNYMNNNNNNFNGTGKTNI